MLQVTRTAVKFASAEQQLVQRVVRKKGAQRKRLHYTNGQRTKQFCIQNPTIEHTQAVPVKLSDVTVR